MRHTTILVRVASGQKLLTVQGTVPSGARFEQPLVSRHKRFQPARCITLKFRQAPVAGTALPLHHSPGGVRRARAVRRRRAGRVQAQDATE